MPQSLQWPPELSLSSFHKCSTIHLMATQAIFLECTLDLVTSLLIALQDHVWIPQHVEGLFIYFYLDFVTFFSDFVTFWWHISSAVFGLCFCETLLNHPSISQKLGEEPRIKARNSQICLSFSFSFLKNKENLIKQFSYNEVAILISGNRDQKILKLWKHCKD